MPSPSSFPFALCPLPLCPLPSSSNIDSPDVLTLPLTCDFRVFIPESLTENLDRTFEILAKHDLNLRAYDFKFAELKVTMLIVSLHGIFNLTRRHKLKMSACNLRHILSLDIIPGKKGNLLISQN